jgi:hypothetical protein
MTYEKRFAPPRVRTRSWLWHKRTNRGAGQREQTVGNARTIKAEETEYTEREWSRYGAWCHTPPPPHSHPTPPPQAGLPHTDIKAEQTAGKARTIESEETSEGEALAKPECLARGGHLGGALRQLGEELEDGDGAHVAALANLQVGVRGWEGGSKSCVRGVGGARVGRAAG